MPGTVTLEEARNILGTVAYNWNDNQLSVYLAQVNYLTTGFLDNFERQKFNGKTLAELSGSITY